MVEKNTNKIILFSAILVGILFNSVSYDFEYSSKNMSKLLNAPVSLEYLKKLNQSNPNETQYRVIQAIKYPTSVHPNLRHPKKRISKEEQINWSIYYLMNKKFNNFKKLLSDNDVLDSPVILQALSSYYSITFQYKELEEISRRFYNHPFYYGLSERYHQLTKKSLFYPYVDPETSNFHEKLSLDKNQSITSVLLLIITFIISFFMSTKIELFKCESCGEIFCMQCDDGYTANFICAACRNIIHRKSNAEAAILVKKTILMENNKDRSTNISRVLSALLPGSGQIYLGNPIKGIIITLSFSFLAVLAIFRFEPFIGFENYSLHFVFGPIYIILAILFVVIYLINMFGRK